MNVQEGGVNVPISVSNPAPNSPAPTNPAGVQRIMPVLYVNQPNMKPVVSAAPSPNSVVSSTSGQTILTAMPQIQLTGGGNPQIIHSSPNPSTYSYVPMRQVYHQTKTIKDAPKKVFVTSINSPNNNKSNQVNLILPNSPNQNTGNKSSITSLILPQIGTVSNKTTITGIMVPNNPTASNTNKTTVASLLLPPNAKYPNIAPNKKVPIPNIIIPQQNMNNKPPNVPNIIRQSNNPSGKNVVGIFSPSNTTNPPQMTSLLLTPNTNTNNKQPPTSVGLILPTSPGSHGIIVPQSTAGQPHGIIVPQQPGGQAHGIIMPQSSGGQSHGIIVPQSTGNQSQLTNLIITSSTATNTPVAASLLISGSNSSASSIGSGHMTSLIIPQSQAPQCSAPISGLMVPPTGAPPTPPTKSLLVPVSVGPNSKGSLLHPATYSNGKKSLDPSSIVTRPTIFAAGRDNKQSVLVKPPEGGNFPSLPPLQPISSNNGIGKTLLAKAPNGLNMPESLVMTPISDIEAIKNKPEKISDEMTIERTPMVSEGTSMATIVRVDDECRAEEMGMRGTDCSEGLVLDGEVTVRRLVGPDKEEIPEKKQIEDDVKIELVKKKQVEDDVKIELMKKKQIDDDVKIELVKPERQKLPPPRYQKPEDLNPMEVLEWDHQGVGKLPGSNIKFRINEYGLDLVVDSNKDESSSNTPNSSRHSYDDNVNLFMDFILQFRINEYGLDLVVDSNKDESSSNTPNSSRRSSDDKPPNTESKTTKDILGEASDKIYCCEGCGCYGLYTEFLMDTRFCSVGCKKIVLARTEIKKKRQDDKMRELRLRRKRRKIKILAQRSKRGSIDQKSGKEQGDAKVEPVDEAELISKAWSTKMVELRKIKKPSEGNIKINLQVSDSDDLRGASPTISDSEVSETISRSPAGSNPSEDDASSDRTASLDVNKEAWLNSSGEFMWSTYLQKCCNKAKAAPVRLFKNPFPDGKNGFKVGMKLEGIDPEHQAIISVLTVAQVRGYRIRLHFDGYPEYHDFWANADSPDIFPPGWCERNSHNLDPPRGYTTENFSWNMYLKQCRAQPAPKSLFPKSNAPLCPSQFRVGMKLEAVDRKNSSLVCVASVANLIDNRILIHFDSWGDVYDYWTDPSSPYIHPVGWCEENGHDLTPPNSYKNPSQFSWDVYLKETKSVAAPARAFKPRPPNAFKRGMKLEAIDKRAPSLLRPATVVEVKDYQIKITFDGYPEEFGYWVDDDCPDIHPTGWGHKTGHPITPPPTSPVKSECGTKDCAGDGNVKGGFLAKHTTAALCPYAPQNLNKDTVPDRFCVNPDFYEVPEPISKTKTPSIKQDIGEDSNSESRIKTRHSTASVKEENKEEPSVKVETEEKTEERIERRGRKRKLPEAESRTDQLDRLRKELIRTVLEPGYQPAPAQQEMWVKHVATLGHKVNVTGGDPRAWNHKQVAAFVNTVIPSRAKLFLDQEIDGEAFLMLTQCDLTKVLVL
ncbi:uncharacterized protein LOC124367224 isoform X4 [Homalodisca vitripennis]|uniref:uncharacterized protein LOC124367224 isoform X3 n=1 Tax=Homalodisca vitripennis TaxID=197043 RepID=UPI001EEB22C4|nr:uncharacterized protein LOC124367224 isoform X3 [Homalodisca vitripennis]XP_046679852.1 uncharacterized protein LOC124367224 isoform X4 [Homalodisca vitripennis]